MSDPIRVKKELPAPDAPVGVITPPEFDELPPSATIEPNTEMPPFVAVLLFATVPPVPPAPICTE
jgi:hypothetical protein